MFYGDNLDPKEAILLRLSSGKTLNDIRRELKSRAGESFIEMQINNTRDYLVKGLLYMGVEEQELIHEIEDWGFNIDDDSVEYVKDVARNVREIRDIINMNVFARVEPDKDNLEDRLRLVESRLQKSEHTYDVKMRRWILQAGGVACAYSRLNVGKDYDNVFEGMRTTFNQKYCDESMTLAQSLREHPIFKKRYFDKTAWREFVDLDKKNLQTRLGIYSLSEIKVNSDTDQYQFPTNGVTSSNGKAAVGAIGDTNLEQMVECTGELGERDLDTESEIKAVCEEEIPSSINSSCDIDPNNPVYVVDERPVITLDNVLDGDKSRPFIVPPEKNKTKWGAFFAGMVVAASSFGVGLAIGNNISEKNESQAPSYLLESLSQGHNFGDEGVLQQSSQTSSDVGQYQPVTEPVLESITGPVNEPVSELVMEELKPYLEVNNNDTFIVDGERLIINPKPGYGLSIYANLLESNGWQELAGLSTEEVNLRLQSSKEDIKHSTSSELSIMLGISRQIAEMNPGSVFNVDFSSYQAVRSGSNNIIRPDKPLIIAMPDLDFGSSLNISFDKVNNLEEAKGGVGLSIDPNQIELDGYSSYLSGEDDIVEKETVSKEDIIKERITESYSPGQALDSVVTRYFNGSNSSNNHPELERIIGSDGSYDERNELEVCLDDYMEISRSTQGYHNSKMNVLSELVQKLSTGQKTDDTWARLSYEEAQDLAVDLYIYGDGYSMGLELNPGTFISVNRIVEFLDGVTEGGFKRKELNQILNEREIQKRNFKESRKAYNAWQSWQRELRKEEAYNSLIESGSLPGLVSDEKSYVAMQNIADQFGCTVDTVKRYVNEYSMEVPSRDFNDLV